MAAYVATAYAHVGRLAEAKTLIASTPADCTLCLNARGLIARLEGDWRAVDRWYGEASRIAPSIPFYEAEWAAALLAKGDLDGASARAQEAHRRSPHFPDALELWGEALLKKGDFAGAVGKFREADKYAPRWGRNHLRWGQALARLGRADEARTQWRAAAGMDLSVADRAELQKVSGRG
jgi:Flp pilus assembly protein TadD